MKRLIPFLMLSLFVALSVGLTGFAVARRVRTRAEPEPEVGLETTPPEVI